MVRNKKIIIAIGGGGFTHSSDEDLDEYVINQVNKSISILKGKPKIKRSMWSRRAQEYEQKITSGKIYDLAEVVRDLNKGDDIMIDQSYSERQLFEKAYERLRSEFEAVLKINPEDVQKKMDKALGRTKISEVTE